MDAPSGIYLFYRFAPFLLVSYFVIGAILNNEVKGFIYLVGLIFTCAMAVMIVPYIGGSSTPSPACDSVPFTGTSYNIPMGMVIFSYTLFYLVFPIAKYHTELTNIPTLVLFPLLILGDIYWNVTFNCFDGPKLLTSIIIGGGFGTLWSFVIDKTGNKSLHYTNIGGNREKCNQVTKTKYRCKTYDQSGNLVEYVHKNDRAAFVNTATGVSDASFNLVDNNPQDGTLQINEIADMIKYKTQTQS